MIYSLFLQNGALPDIKMMEPLAEAGGGTNIAVDGSVAPVEFRYDQSVAPYYRLHGCIITLTKTALTSFDSDVFADLVAALGNGITLCVMRGSTIILDFFDTDNDFTLAEPVVDNMELFSRANPLYSQKVLFDDDGGVYSAVFDLSRSMQCIRMTENDAIVLTVNDDLTGITGGEVCHYGRWE